MKRLIFCFDGTWNRLNADCPTNVVLTAEIIRPMARDGTPQIVYYDEGVGTSKADRLLGGMFGIGMMTNIREAYRFLIFNYEPGDEIFAFGFSRGAFTARSFIGFIRHAGILDVDSAAKIDRAIKLYKSEIARATSDDAAEVLRFRADFSTQICVSEHDRNWRIENCGPEALQLQILEIKYLGVWDSVSALGFPKRMPGARWLNRRFHFHDAKLTSKVQKARHALAIDERRVLFEPEVWNNVAELNSRKDASLYDPDPPYQQKWFPGVHGGVGGGGPIRGLSDGALAWILRGAKLQKLDIRDDYKSRAFDIAPDPFAPLRNDTATAWHDKGPLGWFKRLALSADRAGPDDIIHVSALARRRWLADPAALPDGQPYRPATLAKVEAAMAAMQNVPASDGSETKSMIEHVVVRGDSLSKLAKAYLRDKMRWTEIFDANRDLIDDPDEIFVGMVLKIPRDPAPDTT